MHSEIGMPLATYIITGIKYFYFFSIVLLFSVHKLLPLVQRRQHFHSKRSIKLPRKGELSRVPETIFKLDEKRFHNVAGCKNSFQQKLIR